MAIVNVNHVRKMSAMSSQRWLLTMSNALEIVVSKRHGGNLEWSAYRTIWPVHGL